MKKTHKRAKIKGPYPNFKEQPQNLLLEQAEMFIIKNDEYAKIIKDGNIKEGAQLIVDFFKENI